MVDSCEDVGESNGFIVKLIIFHQKRNKMNYNYDDYDHYAGGDSTCKYVIDYCCLM